MQSTNRRPGSTGPRSSAVSGPRPPSPPDEPPEIFVQLPDRDALRALGEGDRCGVFVPDQLDWFPGQRVNLDLTVPAEHMCLQIAGLVRWRRVAAARGVPAGCWVELIDATGEPMRGEMLRRISASATPRARRFADRSRGFIIGAFGACETHIIDVSRSGARLRLIARPFAIGDTIRLRQRDPEGRPFELACKVIREGDEWVAVRFHDATPEDRKSLAKYLAAVRGRERNVRRLVIDPH